MGGAESTIRNTTKRDSRRENAPTFVDAIERFRDEYGHATGDRDVDMGLDTCAASGIRVCIRKRPLFPHERKEKEFDVITVPPGNENGCHITIHDARMEADMIKMFMNHHTFRYDSVFSEHCTNDDVYSATARHLVRSSLQGNNSTIMMYGQTGSGKTYTMTALQERAFPDLFEQTDRDTVVTCQFVELAGDKCCDMLNAGQPTSLATGADGSMYPFPCVEVNVSSAAELSAVVTHANSLRATAATGVHDHSSRSHAICRIFINHHGVEGQLTLVDLAGTEHRIDSDEHNAERRKEGAMINASLSALKDCIRAHAANAKFIQYRNNRLTQILKSCFSDSRKPHSTIVIATVAPSSKDTEHSLNTLRHACIMDGQGSGQASGSSHLTGGQTVRENLGSVDVAALGRAKFEARKKAREANGGKAPKPVDQTPKPKTPPAHQQKQSNALYRAQLDRAGLAGLPPALRSEIHRSRDPEALRDHPLQKRRLAGGGGGGGGDAGVDNALRRKKSAPKISGLRPRSDAQREGDDAPAPKRAPSRKDMSVARSKEKLAQRPPFEVPGVPLPGTVESPTQESLDHTPVRRDSPQRRRSVGSGNRYINRNERDADVPMPAFAPAPQPHAHPRDARGTSPVRRIAGPVTTSASNAPQNDVEVRDKIEQLTHEANDLWREFKTKGRHARTWRKNDLRLIATHVVPKLPSHVRPATITWMSPELALDELTDILHNLQADQTDAAETAPVAHQGVQNMKLEAAKRKREKLQKERDEAARARAAARQGGTPTATTTGGTTDVTRILQGELAALEERLRDGQASEATRYGLKKQIGLKKAEIKKQQQKGTTAPRPQWQAVEAPPVDPPSQPTPEYHQVAAARTRSPEHEYTRHAPPQIPPQRENQWTGEHVERVSHKRNTTPKFSSPPVAPDVDPARVSPPHLPQAAHTPTTTAARRPPQRENMWARQAQAPNGYDRSPERSPLTSPPQRPVARQPPMPAGDCDWGPLGGAVDPKIAKAARSGRGRYGAPQGAPPPQQPPPAHVQHGRRAGSSDGARPAPADDAALRATKSAAALRRNENDDHEWGPLGGAPVQRPSSRQRPPPGAMPLRQQETNQVNTPTLAEDPKEAQRVKGKRRIGPGGESQISFTYYEQQAPPARASEPMRMGDRSRPSVGYHNQQTPVYAQQQHPQQFQQQQPVQSPLSPMELSGSGRAPTKHGRRSNSNNACGGNYVGAAAAPWGNYYTESSEVPME